MRGVVLSCLISFISAPAFPGTISLIGIGKDGRPVDKTLPTEVYTSRLADLLQSAHDSSLPELNRFVGNQNEWKLRTFVLGLGLDLQLGVPNVLAVEITPALSLVFSNRQDPIVP